MFKKKSKTIIIPAYQHWNHVLDMEFTSEFARYKYLCGNHSKKNAKLIIGDRFITYQAWKTYIEKKVERLTSYELTEYYYFLNNRVRSSSTTASMSISLLSSFLIGFYVPTMLNNMLEFISEDCTSLSPTLIFVIKLVIIIIYAFLLLKIIIGTYKNDELKHYYYNDLKLLLK